MATTARLVDLPSEILIEIFSSLSCKNLASTARICRRLHAISQPVLYRSPLLTPTSKNTSSAIPSLEIFLRTILTPGRETLATHVRSLYIGWDNTPRTTPTDVTFLTPVATLFNFHYPLTSQDAQLMLLLHLLPRLSVLQIESPPHRRSSFTKFMEAKHCAHALLPASLPTGLQSLRVFICPGEAPGPGVSPRTLLTLLKLPQIERIDAYVVDEGRFPYHALNAAASTSPVTKLRLRNADLYSASIEHALRAPRALTRFSYTADVVSHYFTLGAFMSALQALKNTVQYLHLDLSGVEDSRRSGDGTYRAWGFCDWNALRSLSCSMTTLLGGDEGAVDVARVVPLRLREWEVLEDAEWAGCEALLVVEELMAVKSEVVPALERIVFAWGRRAVRARVRVAAEAAGVIVARRFSRW